MPWYSEIETHENLEQGDLLFDCPIVIPPNDPNVENWKDFTVNSFDIIVLTQSCDLAAKKINLVQVCPFVTLSEFCATNTNFDNYKSKESIRRGYLPGYHLLNICNQIDAKEYLIVDFKSTYSISFDFIEQYKNSQEKRIRLNSPYKEHLSQSYARFYMRVGLPSDIPQFKKK
jgi:hypothetical protein